MLKYLIKTITVDAAGASSITFSNIPQNYDDLVLELSARSTQTGTNEVSPVFVRFNGSNTGYTNKVVAYMDSTIARSATNQYNLTSCSLIAQIATNGSTASTFGTSVTHIPNYTKSFFKQFDSEAASLQDSNTDYSYYNGFVGALWSDTSPIRSINIFTGTTGQYSFTQYTTATLYGIKYGSDGVVNYPAAGGVITTAGGYTIHTFTGSGTFIPSRNLEVEYLVIAGGGGGAAIDNDTIDRRHAGGGAGGYRSSVQGEMSGGGASAESKVQVTAGILYPVLVGAGGNGFDSTFGSSSSALGVTSLGGSGGRSGTTGGSGGGGDWAGGAGGGTAGQGYAGGGSGGGTTLPGGGGGAGEAGNTDGQGAGGDGVSSSITGTAVMRGGGGSGGGVTPGGDGGGGAGHTGSNGPGENGVANTGGGGGGSRRTSVGLSYGGNGGSGVVIIRYLTPA